MSKSRSVQNQLFWIATRYLLPGNVVSEVDAVSRNVFIFTCLKMPLICISMEQTTLFFSPMESQGWLYDWTSPGYYRLHSRATSEQHGLQSKLGVEGEGCCMPVRSIQSRFYCMKFYHKKASWYHFWAWAKWVLFITIGIKDHNVMQQNIGIYVSKINAFCASTFGKHPWLLVYSLMGRRRLMRVPFRICPLPQLLKFCTMALYS